MANTHRFQFGDFACSGKIEEIDRSTQAFEIRAPQGGAKTATLYVLRSLDASECENGRREVGIVDQPVTTVDP
jgi:hypothetical protein